MTTTADQPVPHPKRRQHAVTCENCGAAVATSDSVVKILRCPFCGARQTKKAKEQ